MTRYNVSLWDLFTGCELLVRFEKGFLIPTWLWMNKKQTHHFSGVHKWSKDDIMTCARKKIKTNYAHSPCLPKKQTLKAWFPRPWGLSMLYRTKFEVYDRANSPDLLSALHWMQPVYFRIDILELVLTGLPFITSSFLMHLVKAGESRHSHEENADFSEAARESLW